MNNLCANVHVANKGAIDNAVTSLVRNSMRLPEVKGSLSRGFQPDAGGPAEDHAGAGRSSFPAAGASRGF